MKWIDLTQVLPTPDKLYFISDGKSVALAKFKVEHMSWSFLWHTSVFNPRFACEVILPNLPMKETKMENETNNKGNNMSDNNIIGYAVSDEEEKQIHEFFTYHAPKGDQQDRYQILRNEARELAFTITKYVHPGADRDAAIRKLRECIMTANAAIAIEG